MSATVAINRILDERVITFFIIAVVIFIHPFSKPLILSRVVKDFRYLGKGLGDRIETPGQDAS